MIFTTMESVAAEPEHVKRAQDLRVKSLKGGGLVQYATTIRDRQQVVGR